jgi:hypothetical protein
MPALQSLPLQSTCDGLLADGSTLVAPVYYGEARVGELDPVPADVVAIGDEPLVGRGISDRYRIILDRGERVLIES